MFSIDERFELLQAMSAFTRLLALDHAWTDYLQRVEGEVPQSDVRVLRRLADEMDALLADSQEHADRMQQIFAANRGAVADIEARIESSIDLSDEQKRQWRALAEQEGGIVALARRATETIHRDAPSAREALADKIQTIEAGGFTPGDIAASARCGLGVGIAIGSALSSFAFGIGFGVGFALAVCRY